MLHRDALHGLQFALMLGAVALFTGCVEMSMEDEIVFRPDGSGSGRITLKMEKAQLSLAGSPKDVTEQMRKEAPPGVEIKSREDEEWFYLDLTFLFQNPQELKERLNAILGSPSNPAVLRVGFARRSGFFSSTYDYTAELRLVLEGDAAMLGSSFKGWTHRIVMPGGITATNGANLGRAAEWRISTSQPVSVSASASATNLPVVLLLGAFVVGLFGSGGYFLSRARRRPIRHFCDQCGALLPSGARFCDSCGAHADQRR